MILLERCHVCLLCECEVVRDDILMLARNDAALICPPVDTLFNPFKNTHSMQVPGQCSLHTGLGSSSQFHYGSSSHLAELALVLMVSSCVCYWNLSISCSICRWSCTCHQANITSLFCSCLVSPDHLFYWLK